MIEHLEEIQRRMLYVELGYSSLWDFATQELGLSEGAAQRRIQAMRLLRDVPEAKASLAQGRLSLSNAAKVQGFRQKEKKQGRKHDAAELIAQVESLFQRECEQKLFEISPQALPEESLRVVSSEQDRQVSVTIGRDFYEKLERLKGLLAHAKPQASLAELWEYATDQALKQLEEKKGLSEDAGALLTAAAAVERESPRPPGVRIVLPVATKKAVWSKAGGRCEVVFQGRRCESKHRLEIDHVDPLALGGSNDLSNLRLVCWNHNRAEAVRVLGEGAMRATG